MAEMLGMTVEELLTGKKRPLAGKEYNYWLAFSRIRAAESDTKPTEESVEDEVARANAKLMSQVL